jgi:hypothetical protein
MQAEMTRCPIAAIEQGMKRPAKSQPPQTLCSIQPVNPNGIVLINGKELFRATSPDVTSVTDVVKQKGLILASNLPVISKESLIFTPGAPGEKSLTRHCQISGRKMISTEGTGLIRALPAVRATPDLRIVGVITGVRQLY